MTKNGIFLGARKNLHYVGSGEKLNCATAQPFLGTFGFLVKKDGEDKGDFGLELGSERKKLCIDWPNFLSKTSARGLVITQIATRL